MAMPDSRRYPWKLSLIMYELDTIQIKVERVPLEIGHAFFLMDGHFKYNVSPVEFKTLMGLVQIYCNTK